MPDGSSLTHNLYENIRKGCCFHDPNELKKCSFENKMSMIHINARSLINKFDEIKLFLSTHKWDLILVSETWFNNINEEEFSLDNYNLFYSNRVDKTGGGSAIYVQTNIKAEQISLFEFTTAEAVFLKINRDNEKSYLIIQIYRAPKNNLEFLSELEHCLVEASKLKLITFIAGDFNADLFSMSQSNFNGSFFSLMCSFGFLPTISKATRVSNSSVTLIDNIFCNDISVINESGVIKTDFSDHFSIFSSLNLKSQNKSTTRETKVSFDYNYTNNLKQFLIDDLQDFQNEDNPDNACSILLNSYKKGITKFSKVRHVTRKNSAIQPWITSGLLKSINKKCILFNIKLKYPTKQNILKYNKYRNCLNKALRNAKKSYFESEFAKHHNNPKETWETLNQLLQRKTSKKEIPTKLKTEQGDTIENDASIANEFNRYFAEVGQTLKNKIPVTGKDPTDKINSFQGDEMVLSPTSREEIEEIIMSLNNVGAGLDKINARIFKNTYKSILPHLVHFFNLCLKKGCFPNQLKVAVIKPIFKAGDSAHFTNYRPISILPFLSKILEKIIYIRLLTHLADNDLLSNKQFGFRKGLATYMPILLIQDLITKSFEEDEYIVGIFLDLKKAFDTVDHNILCKKLQKYGISGKSLCILKSYLADRQQTVNIRDSFSELRDIKIGVPQGSILGPLLFIIYINDLVNVDDTCKFFIYADDTAIFFKHNNPTFLQNQINAALPKISEWLQANFLSLNVSKTIYQLYSKHKSHIDIKVEIDGVEIKKNTTVKYLGVLIDDDMNFKSHIDAITNIVSRNVGMMSRVKFFVENKQLLQIYNAIILPHINYCCLIWGSGYALHTKKILTLQKRAMRIIEGIFPPQSASPVFKKYKILKIQDIAKMQMMLIMHKVLCNNLPLPIKNMFKFYTGNSYSTRQNKHFQETFSAKNYRLLTISCLGPKLWNNMIAEKYTRDEVPHSKEVIKKMMKEMFIHEY